MNEFKIRHANPKDIPLIYATWLNSYRYDGIAIKCIKNSIYFPEQSKVIDKILGHPNTHTLVAHVKDEIDVALAYLVYTGNIIHYCFTKETFQEFGLMTALATHAFGELTTPLQCSHLTFAVTEVINRHPNIIYNPYKQQEI